MAFLLGLTMSSQQAPDFTLIDVKGETYNLYQQLNQGKTVVLDFFGVQCGTCQTDIAYLENIYQTYGGENGNLVIWGIESLGFNNTELDAFVTAAGGTYPRFGLGGNTDLLQLYQVTAIPGYYVICPNGFVKPVSIESIPNYVDACAAMLGSSQTTPRTDRLSSLSFNQNILNINFESAKSGELQFELYDVLGNKVTSKRIESTTGQSTLSIHTLDLRRGFYIVRMIRGKELISSKRTVKN
jgi:thiol-disulfide isomerase/thioredoxin